MKVNFPTGRLIRLLDSSWPRPEFEEMSIDQALERQRLFRCETRRLMVETPKPQFSGHLAAFVSANWPEEQTFLFTEDELKKAGQKVGATVEVDWWLDGHCFVMIGRTGILTPTHTVATGIARGNKIPIQYRAIIPEKGTSIVFLPVIGKDVLFLNAKEYPTELFSLMGIPEVVLPLPKPIINRDRLKKALLKKFHNGGLDVQDLVFLDEVENAIAAILSELDQMKLWKRRMSATLDELRGIIPCPEESES